MSIDTLSSLLKKKPSIISFPLGTLKMISKKKFIIVFNPLEKNKN